MSVGLLGLQRLEDMQDKAAKLENKKRHQAQRLATTHMAMERKRELLHNKLQLKSAINSTSSLPKFNYAASQNA